MSSATVPPLSKGNFTGAIDLSNPWGNYYNDYTQTGTVNISVSVSALGGRAHVKIAANGSSNINFSGISILRGVANNSAWPSGNYEVYFEKTSSGVTVNVLRY